MKIRSEDITFKHLFKITKIELDIVTFKKYNITKNSTLSSEPGYEVVELAEEIGTEIHRITPELLADLIGNTGIIVKSLVVRTTGKRTKKVFVSKLIKIDNEEVG